VRLDDKGGDLATLKEARIVRLRAGVVANLPALDAAGVVLRWARHLFPPRTREPDGWRVLVELLDALDGGCGSPRAALAHAGIAMLAAVGYAIDFDRCVGCGRPCPDGRAACVDPARGGLVCVACGGAARVLAPADREAARLLASGRTSEVTSQSAEALLGVVDRVMAVHTGFES
jgi:DNA repair protein RecO (recombination protein O)